MPNREEENLGAKKGSQTSNMNYERNLSLDPTKEVEWG